MNTMTAELDIHVASDAERRQAHRNVHDVWGRGLPVEELVRRRLESPSHQRATWFVGTLEGRVVTSLGAYPVAFYLNGQSLDGIAIGSVHTLATCRGCGYAPRLIEWAEQHERGRGVRLSMLYSDIDPGYYARLGYVQCPNWEGWRAVDDDAPLPDSSGWRLDRFDPAAELTRVAEMYAAYHGTSGIAVCRRDDYWRHLLEKRKRDEFYWLRDAADAVAGYVRIAPTRDAIKIADYAFLADEATAAEALYRELLHLGRGRGMVEVGGWLPDTPVARALFDLRPRTMEITMIKPLDDSIELARDIIASADRFCEIDHV